MGLELVVLVIHLFIALALVGVILLQRSEGGALGVGGGGTAGGIFSARGAANALTRATAFLALAFFCTSITLGLMAQANRKPSSIVAPPATQGPSVPAPIAPTTPLPAPTPQPAPAPAP